LINRRIAMGWKKGESGNVLGRPPGTGEVASLRAALAQHLPDVISALVEAAKKGDTAAAKLILERTIPALRPEELPVCLDGVSGSRAEMVSAVIDAIASGKLDNCQRRASYCCVSRGCARRAN
jgi:hypothetical protein